MTLFSKQLFLSSALAAMALTSFAQAIQSGTFISARLGASQYQSPTSNIPNTTAGSVDRRGVAWGLTVGYNYARSPNRYVGVEMGFNRYGQAKYKGTINSETGTAKIRQYDIDMLFGVGLVSQNGLNATVKLGVARVTQDVSGADIFGNNAFEYGNENKTRYRPKAVLEVGFMPSDYLNLSLMWSHIFAKSYKNYPVRSSNTITNNAVFLNAQYTLPQ